MEERPARIRGERRSSGKDSVIGRPLSSHSSYSDIDDSGRSLNSKEVPTQNKFSKFLSLLAQPFADIQPKTKRWARQVVRILTGLVVLVIAIVVPSFDRVVGELPYDAALKIGLKRIFPIKVFSVPSRSS